MATRGILALIGPSLPKLGRRKDGRGRPWRENRAVLNGILRILRTGAPCADLPDRYPMKSLVKATIAQRLVLKTPEHLVGDAAYESDQLDAELAQRGIELIAPHRRDRKRKTQDGRPLGRYRRRWKVQRLFAWLGELQHLLDAGSRRGLCPAKGPTSALCIGERIPARRSEKGVPQRPRDRPAGPVVCGSAKVKMASPAVMVMNCRPSTA